MYHLWYEFLKHVIEERKRLPFLHYSRSSIEHEGTGALYIIIALLAL